jgi:orotate phosphoribosyltransferase
MFKGETIADILLTIKAVHLSPKNPFTWTSGIVSPIYCDNRQIISYPQHRETVANAFCDIIKEHYQGVEVIAGTSTAGIPHAAWVAQILNLPMVYVRGGSKGHGLKNAIEGKLEKGSKVVLIEDLVSTGKSSVAAVEELQAAGAEVLSTLAIFSYELEKSKSAFEKAKIPLHTLCQLDTLLTHAKNCDIINESEVSEVYEFFRSLDQN